VATTSEAAERFKVTDKNHERRIVLSGGGKKMAEVLVGTAPAYKQIYARAEGDNAIYNVAMGTYEAGVNGEDWMYRDFLAVPIDKVAGISFGDVTLEKKDGKLTVAGLSAEEQAKTSEVQRLVGAVIHARFDTVQGKGKDALAKLDPPDFQITVKRTEGAPVIYKYKKEAGGGAYLFADMAHDYLFRVSEKSIEPIVKAKRETLVEPKKEAEPKPGEAKAEDAKKDEAAAAKDEPKTDEAKKDEAKKDEASQAPKVQQTGSGG
jgi:hypothetical protein